MATKAVRIKQADGTWQDIALMGPPGPVGPASTVPGPKGDPGGTMGSAVFKMLTMAGAVSATGWRALAVNTAGPTIDPAGSFTANTDSVTITEAGWYTISVAVLITVGGGVPLTITFSDAPAAAGGYIQSVATSAAGDFRNVAHTTYLAAGSKLYVNAYTAASSSVRLDWLTIARVGGPQGIQGPQGPPGEDGVGGSGGGVSLPDGGTTGQHLAKASDNDGDADWVDVDNIRAAGFSSGQGAATAVPNAAFTLLPCSTTFTAEPAEDFTRNSDGTVTVNKAGWYTISASGGGQLPATAVCEARICLDRNSGYYLAIQGQSIPGGKYPNNAMSAIYKLNAGQVVGLYVYQESGSAGAGWVCFGLGIARVGGPKGDTGATGGNATVPMDPWHLVGAAGEPAYAANCSGGLRFRKDPLGRVWLFGTASSPTTPTTVFTLPAGYRPAIDFIYDNLQSAGLAGTYVQINTAGAVTITWPQGSGYVDLSFDTGLVTAMPTGPKGDPGGTMDAVNYRSSNIGSPGPSQSVTVPAWAVMDPRVSGEALIEPAGSFIENADKTVTVVNAGWYAISASVITTVNYDGTITVKIDRDGTTTLANQGARGEPGRGAQANVSTSAVKLAAGAKISIQAIAGPLSGTVSCMLQQFSISRVGGPQGPKGKQGDKGDPAGLEVYAQLAQTTARPRIAVTSQTWTLLPIPATLAISSASGSPDFTRNADGSLTINVAGNYHFEASVQSGAALADNVNWNFVLCRKAGATPAIGDQIAQFNFTSGGTQNNYPAAFVSADQVCAVGDRIATHLWENAAGSTNVDYIGFSAHKTGVGPKGDKGDTGGSATVPIDPWHKVGSAGEPAFQNNWIAYDSDVYFRKDPLGRVWIRGSVNGGLTGTVVFTLPVGYRPVLAGLTRVRAIALENQIAAGQWESQVSVHPDGSIYAYTITPTGQAYISLDQIDFDSGTVTAMPTGPQGPKGDTGGNATVPIEAWKTIGSDGGATVFANGCTAGFPVPAYRKDPAGYVMMRGQLNVPAGTNVVAFTLPAGYRPAAMMRWSTYIGGVNTQMTVDTNGIMQTYGTNVGWIDLSDIFFPTDQTTYPTGPQGPPGPGVRGLVTALPVNPQDGDECYFQTAAMATDGIVWHLRYRAASVSAYKWEYIGGPEWIASVVASASSTATSWADFSDGLPAVTLPLAGDYNLAYGANVGPNGNGQGAGVAPTGAPGASWAWCGNPAGATGGSAAVSNSVRSLAVPAGVLKLQGWCGVTGATFSQRWLSVKPIRVG